MRAYLSETVRLGRDLVWARWCWIAHSIASARFRCGRDRQPHRHDAWKRKA